MSAWLSKKAAGASGYSLALLISIGIGLHNLGEGVAIGAAYAAGALALGAFLVVGFAIHNTTEGLAIVAPIAQVKTLAGRLALLGLIAGGARRARRVDRRGRVTTPRLRRSCSVSGRARSSRSLVTLLPSLRDDDGRTLHPAAVTGILGGMAMMFPDRPAGRRLMAAAERRRPSEAIEDYA